MLEDALHKAARALSKRLSALFQIQVWFEAVVVLFFGIHLPAAAWRIV
jgi:hypothetical protein